MVAEDGDVIGAGLILPSEESSTVQRAHAEDVEEAGGHEERLQRLRIACASQVGAAELVGDEPVEAAVAVAPGGEFMARYMPVARLAALVDPHHPAGIRERQRPQQDRIDDAEGGGVRANPDRQGQDGDGRHPRRSTQGAEPVAKILEQRHGAARCATVVPCMDVGWTQILWVICASVAGYGHRDGRRRTEDGLSKLTAAARR